MSDRLLEQLEAKINNAIEAIELLRLQVEELEEKNEELEKKNQALQNDNTSLKGRQSDWEHSLTSLLGKLDNASIGKEGGETRKVEHFEEIEEEILV